MEVVVLDKVEVMALGNVEVGVVLLLHWCLQSLGASNSEMFYATRPYTLISSHSTFKSGVVSAPTFPI